MFDLEDDPFEEVDLLQKSGGPTRDEMLRFNALRQRRDLVLNH